MRVVSFNIKNDYQTQARADTWQNRKHRVFSKMTSLDADLFGLQEVSSNQFITIRDHYKADYGIVGAPRDDAATTEYNPILYRLSSFSLLDSGTFWLSNTPSLMSKSADWQAACYRIATWAKLKTTDGQQFIMINTHLDHESEEARYRGIKVIKEFIAREKMDRVVLTGDFNGNYDERFYQLITDGLLDTSASEKRTVETVTFIGEFVAEDFRPEEFRYIDFIFVSADMETVDFKLATELVDGRLPSDHYPVVAVIKEGQE